MKKPKDKLSDELRPEYDLARLLKNGVRGKYAKRYHAVTNLVLLDPLGVPWPLVVLSWSIIALTLSKTGWLN